jgi:hypothetical protein
MYLRAQGGGASIVDRLLKIRPDLEEAQNNYNSLTGDVAGTRKAIGYLDDNLRQARTLMPDGLLSRQFESQMDSSKQEVAGYRSQEKALGQKIMTLYGQGCDLIAQAGGLVAK